MKNEYYEKFLDSANIIKDFGLSNKPTTINGQIYWEVLGNDQSYFNFKGFIRFENDKLLFLPYSYKECLNYFQVKEFILFDFQNQETGNKIFYKCSENYYSGDTINLVKKYYDEDIKDTIYQLKFRSFQLNPNSKNINVTHKQKYIGLSKKIGFIDGLLTNGIDSISVSFYPELKRLNDEFFGKKNLHSL